MKTTTKILINKEGRQYEKLTRHCALCSKEIKVTLYTKDSTYRGGHFFFEKNLNDPNSEYWECSHCYFFAWRKMDQKNLKLKTV
jgi:hypothetical protein